MTGTEYDSINGDLTRASRVLTRIAESAEISGVWPTYWMIHPSFRSLDGYLSPRDVPVREEDFTAWKHLLTQIAGEPSFEAAPHRSEEGPGKLMARVTWGDWE